VLLILMFNLFIVTRFIWLMDGAVTALFCTYIALYVVC